MVTMKSTPLDAPLFRMDSERGIEYWGCRAVMAGFTVAGDVGDLIPRGLHLDSPAIGAVLVADYGASTLGPYGEFVSFLRVVDDAGTEGLYVPYIYVTDDAAMAAGREVLGAPKKLAAIDVQVRPEAVSARWPGRRTARWPASSSSRPSGCPPSSSMRSCRRAPPSSRCAICPGRRGRPRSAS